VDPAWPIMEQLLECTNEQLQLRGLGVPKYQMIQPGGALPIIEHAGIKGCVGDCDELIVWLENEFPVSAFPTQDETGATTGSEIAVVVNVGIFRAQTALPTNNGQRPPAPEKQVADARTQSQDTEAMRQAIRCCATGRQYVLGPYQPLASEGAQFGGYWQVTVSSELV
jgi:hypothetical protein